MLCTTVLFLFAVWMNGANEWRHGASEHKANLLLFAAEIDVLYHSMDRRTIMNLTPSQYNILCIKCHKYILSMHILRRFYRGMLRGGAADHSVSSVRLSVCPSVTFRYRDHMCWNTSKIISRLITLTFTLELTPSSGKKWKCITKLRL